MTGPLSPLHSSQYSRFQQRVSRRYAREMPLLEEGVPNLQTMADTFATLRGLRLDCAGALRVLRQLVIERLLRLDCEQGIALQDVTLAMTRLAEFALTQACDTARDLLEPVHGVPVGSDGTPTALWVVGMGKLGARELNVSSDIDLIYVYEQDGETTGSALGRGRISNQEYFAKAVRVLFGLIGETTEHGLVFRVDLALRPNGNSGPPAVSLGALEEYLHVQGREWERFAWLKSRVLASLGGTGTNFQALRGVVLPFVFRRYLDYSVFDALRTLHRQIREHANKRSTGRPERANDVKLSRGGIREIEFIVQLLQVVRGGQFPELRTRATLEALPRLAKAGLMTDQTAQSLAQAYVFLRQVEHRIQYLDDQQTHVLPTQDQDLAWIALTMGYTSTHALLCQLDSHRELVAQEFDALLGGQETRSCKSCQPGKSLPEEASLEDLALRTQGDLGVRLTAWCSHPRVLALRDESRTRLLRLLGRTARWVTESRASELAAVRLVDWIEPLLRRESYLALLLERPSVHERLLRLLGAARWPARYLMQHPGVIDELASADLLQERFNAQTFESELEHRRLSLQGTAEDDDETLLNLLRRAHHAEVFRTLARDVEDCLSVEAVADDLSALADAVLRVTTRWCWSRLKTRHREHPEVAIIAYGKLGGKELGYGSDLDIVFVYEDADERAGEIYAALVRKLINWLTVKTGEGDLYEIDTALRPNGNSGLLITTFEAYASYQQQRGSNTAWTWEHQAMTRARFCMGSAALERQFEAVRTAVLRAPREPDELRKEIVSMRERVRLAHPLRDADSGLFDIKHSAGGMIDVEFVIQYLVLAHAAQHPELVANTGNIALLEQAQAIGLLQPGLGHAAASAYRALRKVQHRARLDEQSTQLPVENLRAERDAVLSLWQSVFKMPQT